jgi:hypothetical protein
MIYGHLYHSVHQVMSLAQPLQLLPILKAQSPFL